MQKLVIKSQFMGVKPCEIELRRFLLLIGEQASGKSTIAKLIYFFQTLPEAIYENAELASARDETFDFARHAQWIARDKFYETFGSTFHLTNDFEIHFKYGDSKVLKIYRHDDGRSVSDFQGDFGRHLRRKLEDFFQSPKGNGRRTGEILRKESLRLALDKLFNRKNTDYNYIIAGRSLLTAFPRLIADKMEFELKRLIEDEIKQQDFQKRRRVGNEHLVRSFVLWADEIVSFFSNNGRTFESISELLENHKQLEQLQLINFKVLKGNYDIDSYGEMLRINEGREKVYLKDASSGQQEVLRILQAIYLSVGLRNRREFLVIEEPEAHLYPLAQKELINAFAVFLNAIKEGRLIITTHSPYILACVNILLLAHFVNKERGGNGIEQKISEAAVPKDYWLDPADFTAYAIGHSDVYCRNIKDDVTGLVAENYLDSISGILGMQSQYLFNLLLLNEA